MFTGEKRPVSTAWVKRDAAAAASSSSSAPPAAQLKYRCPECKAVEVLEETAAILCSACGWRILTKETREPRRCFGTD
jgi:DNA-directed RNA polymerase subunit RPC12/RpoP